MKKQGHISFSHSNSSSEGTLTYSTPLGSIELDYSNWGEVVLIPTPEEWKLKFGASWAKDERDVIIQDLVSQSVNAIRPDVEVTKYSIVFFDAKARESKRQEQIAAAKAMQSPSVETFLGTFEKLPEEERSQKVVCVLDVLTCTPETAECVVSEVLYGAKTFAGTQLKIGFDRDVPVFTGRKYITCESEQVLKQYLNTSHRWRCRLHFGETQAELEKARLRLTMIK